MVLFLIIANSVCLALTDYAVVDPSNEYLPAARGKQVTDLDIEASSSLNNFINSIGKLIIAMHSV